MQLAYTVVFDTETKQASGRGDLPIPDAIQIAQRIMVDEAVKAAKAEKKE